MWLRSGKGSFRDEMPETIRARAFLRRTHHVHTFFRERDSRQLYHMFDETNTLSAQAGVCVLLPRSRLRPVSRLSLSVCVEL